jgi:hypothetical protein
MGKGIYLMKSKLFFWQNMGTQSGNFYYFYLILQPAKQQILQKIANLAARAVLYAQFHYFCFKHNQFCS